MRPAAITLRSARFWDRAARKYAAAPIDDLAGYDNTLRSVQALLAQASSADNGASMRCSHSMCCTW